MQESIFTKILNHEIPGEIVFQDDQSFVLLTIDPINPGHLLVIPKKVVDHLWDIEDPLYSHLLLVSKKMALAMRTSYPEYPRIGMFVEGYGVPHAHVHVFGYTEPLEPTVQRHIADTHTTTPSELKIEADKIRLALS